ncbi:MAG: hypothetical protein M5R41_02810 [Bacteroidia bacterium]|nr:hypothetical protein [Bacteroidia bacterium]
MGSYSVRPSFPECLLIALLFFSAVPLSAQDGETSMFGSFQAIFFTQKSRVSVTDNNRYGKFSLSEERSSFAIQQLDIFLHREIDDEFSAFIDLEYQLNYSSEHRWGSMSVQEAWLQYAPMDEFTVKAGLLYPSFNHLNEIKNRLALLPYIFRPGVYERLLSRLYNSENYIPEHAFLQIHGAIPLSKTFIDYAVYTGNAEASYITRMGPDGALVSERNQNFEFLSGVDPTDVKLKLFGGRVGMRSRDEQIKAGISWTHDYDNLRDTLSYMPSIILPRADLVGDAPRNRLGADLSGSIGPVQFEGEYIGVFYDYEKAERLGIDMSLSFVYGMLGYWFTDQLFLYTSGEAGHGTFGESWRHTTFSVGASMKLNPSVTAKGQFIVHEQLYDKNFPSDKAVLKFVFIGLSVLL